jgi:Secretion system C-terminal sorting domain
MRKSILITALASSFTLLNTAVAQPVITHLVIPVVGDSSIMAVDTTLQSEGTSGANLTWNFTSLQNNYSVKRLYKLPSQTPYDSVCLGANMVRTDSAGSFYTFWNSSADSLIYFGFIQPGVQSQTYNANPMNYYHFPIHYNDTFTDSLTSFTLPGAFVGNGIYTFKADAYGTLQLPNQIFNNTLRVKSEYYIGDSTIGSYSLTTEYAWYEANAKEPLLVIEKVIVDSLLVTSYILFNNAAPLGIINSNLNEASVDIFPNPVLNKLHIHSNELIKEPIEITNLLGVKFPSQQSTDLLDTEINVSSLASGIYFTTIKFQNGSFVTRKFFKQ